MIIIQYDIFHFKFKTKMNFLSFLLLFLSLYTITSKVDEGSIVVHMKSVNVTVPYNSVRKYFTIPVQIGTPKQIYNVQVDTSVSTSWLPAAYCKNCKKATKLYEHKNSSTSSPTDQFVELEDENGNVKGFKIQDTIEVSGFKMKQYGFVEVSEIDGKFNDHFDGKLGLGYNGQIGDEFNFMKKLKNDNLISKMIFSINEINSTFGFFLFGDSPVSEYKYCNVLNDTSSFDDKYKESWICNMTQIGFIDNENKMNFIHDLSENTVNFDSAYDYIAAPKGAAEIFKQKLFEKLKCESETIDNELVYSCDKQNINQNLTISFILGNNGYNIPLSDLFIENKSKIEFMIRFRNDEEKMWTYGYPFMRQFMLIFNMEDNHVGIHSTRQNSITDMNSYYNSKAEETTSERNKFLLKVFGVIAGILALIVIYLIIRGLRRRKIEGGRGFVFSEEIDDRIY